MTLSLPTLWVSSIGSSTFRGGLRSGQGEDLERVLAQLRAPLDDSILFTPVEDSQATHHSIPSPQSVAGHLEFKEFPAHYSPITPYPSPTCTPVHSPRSPTLLSLLFDDLNPLQFTMADITPLPARGERNAPKFDPDYEEQLPTFFDEFQDAASKAGIIADHPTMKKECLRYVSVETICFWRSLATFKDDTKTWSEFKTKVLSNYPDAMQSAEVTMDELKKVVEDHSKTRITSVKSLAKYHRSFSTVASLLAMDQGVLSAVQAARHYVEVFPEQVKTRLHTRLQVQYPNKKKGEAFTLSELKGVIDYLLSDASTATLSGSFSLVVKSEISDVECQIRSLTEAINKLASVPSQPSSSSSSPRLPPRRGPNNEVICRWNNCLGHVMRDCPDLAEWLSKGRLE
ncbi:hypothetical protein AAF712_015342 [Marasmius tenuissimus]|uniref:Retrotransposon gag domain-containing protein n=1 Tax=Marasmius tenuissimus TaxID=585030 RepID=A0ABR2Z8L5_9AGAR